MRLLLTSVADVKPFLDTRAHSHTAAPASGLAQSPGRGRGDPATAKKGGAPQETSRKARSGFRKRAHRGSLLIETINLSN